MKKQTFGHICLLLSLNLLVWLNTFSFEFFNDDFQILEYAKQHYSENPLNAFTSKDISQVYYRPIPNFFLGLILNLFGFNPSAFHIYLFILYTCVIFSSYYLFRKLSGSSHFALLGAGFFSILPSHDIYLVWIASNGDLWATLSCVIFATSLLSQSKSKIYISIISISIAFFSKESTIFAPFLPLFLLPSFNNRSKEYITISSISLFILLTIFVYREFYLGINFLESSNLSNISAWNIFLNFFAYIPAMFIPSFIPPILFPSRIAWLLIFLAIAFVAFLLHYCRRTIKFRNINSNYLFGILWYVLFVLPVVTLFMRWYNLLPSIGIIIVILEILLNKSTNGLYIIKIAIPVFLIFSTINIYSTSGWQQANFLTQKILKSVSSIQTQKKSIMLWFFPQYYNNYIILRSGIHQAVNHHSKTPFDEIMMPISIAMSKYTTIQHRQIDASSFEFTTENADLFFNNRKEIIKDSSIVSNESYQLKIVKIGERKFLLTINFFLRNGLYANYYFDGKGFRPFGN